MATRYHHGDLRAAVLRAAADVIARDGAEQFSLRSVAQELGVSHTAFRHHFGSREGVFTALAADGFYRLGDALAVAAQTGSFAAVGSAYVQFSVDHPGHFAVMHRPDLVDAHDVELLAAQERTTEQLNLGAASHTGARPEDVALAAIAAWSLVHGLAVLTLSGSLDGLLAEAGGDLASVAERAALLLFRSDSDD